MITKEQMQEFEEFRKSGRNQFDIQEVTAYTSLKRYEVEEIHKNYDELLKEYNIKR